MILKKAKTLSYNLFFLLSWYTLRLPAIAGYQFMSDKEWSEHLTSIHDVDWKLILAKNDNNKSAIKDKLLSVIQHQDTQLAGLDTLQKRIAWENALRGFGHFANTQDFSTLRKVEQKLSQQDDDYGKIALYESLKNSGSREALNFLAQLAQEERDLWLAMQALSSGEKIITGESSMGFHGDLIYIPYYFPNLEESFIKRPSANDNNISWDKAIEELLAATEKIQYEYQQQTPDQIHPDMNKYFQKLEENFMKALNEAKVASYLDPSEQTNIKDTPILLAQAGEVERKEDFGTVGQTVGRFSDHDFNEKSELAKKIEEQNGTDGQNVRVIASEDGTIEQHEANASSPGGTPSYLLYGVIVLLFATMIFVGLKFSKKKK